MLEQFRKLMRMRQLLRSSPVVAVAKEFDEMAYLGANPDVAAAVASGQFRSGREHFDIFGRNERRSMGTSRGQPVDLATAKARKIPRIRPLLRADLPVVETGRCFDFLSAELRREFDIVDTDAVSSNNYDAHVLGLIERHRDGMILDCGAGKRSVYYDNVVNFEIAAYETTDVRGVGEVLPFVDSVFDAVISIAVLEHVKDPFRCASEIVRVLKPGGELICCVPFLQPYHGYPHHYYNMTHQGLRNLFADRMTVERIEVYESVLPIWSLTWIVSSWAEGLHGATRQQFLDMRLGDLLKPPSEFLKVPFVTDLPPQKNLELASACVLFGRKW
jgi:SAM-dependent methyltransferase